MYAYDILIEHKRIELWNDNFFGLVNWWEFEKCLTEQYHECVDFSYIQKGEYYEY